MAEHKKTDMGTGSVKKLMLKMAVPALVGQIVNLLYNIVDRIYIGHIPEIGGAALTGVGLFTPILMLITAFAMLAGAGGAPRAAIAMGRGEKETAEKIMANCFTVLMILAVVLTAGLYFAAPDPEQYQQTGYECGTESPQNQHQNHHRDKHSQSCGWPHGQQRGSRLRPWW